LLSIPRHWGKLTGSLALNFSINTRELVKLLGDYVHRSKSEDFKLWGLNTMAGENKKNRLKFKEMLSVNFRMILERMIHFL
jgi:hypothetical protein